MVGRHSEGHGVFLFGGFSLYPEFDVDRAIEGHRAVILSNAEISHFFEVVFDVDWLVWSVFVDKARNELTNACGIELNWKIFGHVRRFSPEMNFIRFQESRAQRF